MPRRPEVIFFSEARTGGPRIPVGGESVVTRQNNLGSALSSFFGKRKGMKGTNVAYYSHHEPHGRIQSYAFKVTLPETFLKTLGLGGRRGVVFEPEDPHLIVELASLQVGGVLRLALNHVASPHPNLNGLAQELGRFLSSHKKVGAPTTVYLSPQPGYPISRVF